MAGNKLIGRVQASTILEVVISMIVIVVVFGIAMMIVTNVSRLSLSGKKLRADALLQMAADSALASKTITLEDFRVEQEVKPYGQNNDLMDVHLTAYDQNQQKVAELEKIITSP